MWQTKVQASTALPKSSACLCIKSTLSRAIQMPEIRDYYDFMSCWKTGGGEHNVCVGFKCLLRSFLSLLIDAASVFRLWLLGREKKKKAEDLIQRSNYSCTLVDRKYMGGWDQHSVIYHIPPSLKNTVMLGSAAVLLQELLPWGLLWSNVGHGFSFIPSNFVLLFCLEH